MTFLKNLRIRNKILLGYTIVALVFTSLAIYIFISTRTVIHETRKIETYNYPRIELTTQLIRSLALMDSLETTIQSLAEMNAPHDTAILKRSQKALETQIAKMETSLTEYEELIKDDITAVPDAIALRNDFESYKAKMPHGESCTESNAQCRLILPRIRGHADDIYNEILGQLSLELGHISELADKAFKIYMILLLCAITAGVFISAQTGLSLSKPIARLIEQQNDFKDGKDIKPLRDIRLDEIGELQSSFYDMAQQLKIANELIKKHAEEDKDKLNSELDKVTQKLEKAHETMLRVEKMAAIGQLAAGVAHELNNPLGIILGFSQSLAKRYPAEDPISAPLCSIERETMRCKNLVQNLLVFSRVSVKSDQHETTDLNTEIENSISLLAHDSRSHAVAIQKEFAPGLPPILANKSQLQQVVINLANNAIDAMPKGGTLTIRTKLSEKRTGHLELQFQDTGHGIPKEIQSKIYDPFFTTKEVGKGTGLGLALVFEIIKKHEGSIELESKEGHGATFTILLPIKTAQ